MAPLASGTYLYTELAPPGFRGFTFGRDRSRTCCVTLQSFNLLLDVHGFLVIPGAQWLTFECLFTDVIVFDQPQTDILLALWVHDGLSTLRQWGAIRPHQTKSVPGV